MSGQSFTLIALLVAAYLGVWFWIFRQQTRAQEDPCDQLRTANTFPTEMIRDAGELLRMARVLSTVRWKRSHERYLERDRRPRQASRRPFRRVR